MTFRPALIRQTFIWASAFVMTGFALTSVVSAQVINNTGPRSKNTIKIDTNIKCEIKNDNDIDIKNKNDQDAKSGNAIVENNGSRRDGHRDGLGIDGVDGASGAGSAITGDAVNQNDTSTDVNVENNTELPDICNNRPRNNNFVACRSVCNANAARSFRNNNAFRAANAFAPAFAPSAAAVAAPAVALTGVGGAGAGAVSPAEAPILSEAAAAPFFAEAPFAAEDFASAASCSSFCCSSSCSSSCNSCSSSVPAVISNTGPNSTNSINSKLNDTVKITNNNDISVNNTNNQTATSGTAKVTNNRSGGDAESGSSLNSNSTDTAVSVAN